MLSTFFSVSCEWAFRKDWFRISLCFHGKILRGRWLRGFFNCFIKFTVEIVIFCFWFAGRRGSCHAGGASNCNLVHFSLLVLEQSRTSCDSPRWGNYLLFVSLFIVYSAGPRFDGPACFWQYVRCTGNVLRTGVNLRVFIF